MSGPRDSVPYRVRCFTCRRYGTNQPLTIHELCSGCADTTAAEHRSRGHEVEVLPPQPPERVPENVHQLTRRTGW